MTEKTNPKIYRIYTIEHDGKFYLGISSTHPVDKRVEQLMRLAVDKTTLVSHTPTGLWLFKLWASRDEPNITTLFEGEDQDAAYRFFSIKFDELKEKEVLVNAFPRGIAGAHLAHTRKEKENDTEINTKS